MRRFSFQKVASAEEEENHYDYRVPARARRSFHRSSSVLSIVSSRNSFSYDKLSQVPIQVTIVKLDGSSFEVDVGKMATIAELKLAVERRFNHLPIKGTDDISWRHVWGHFCLCYRGQKLLNDSDFIKDYGIKDGDQLRFIRHVSVAYNLIKKHSRKRIEAPKSNTILEGHEEERQKPQIYDDTENVRCQQYKNEEPPKIRRRHWTFKMGKWISCLL
ncbi:uncharacterized protein LOC141600280 isoform X2 [Silene latifolia]|uniref:uncharacterized protein LOC141600280 isoform X2 n=1 Tax=Silene latifolia TaxID=37657 RepID=UPI003D7807AD